jgi:hypothetical protein
VVSVPSLLGQLGVCIMTILAEEVSPATKTRINVASLSADVVFGGIMLIVALLATATYGLDLGFAFF